MELEEFKYQWKKRMDEENSSVTPDKHSNNTNMGIAETLEKLNMTTQDWWKLTRNSVQFLFGVLAVGIIINMLLPSELQQSASILSYLVLALCGAVSLWLTYEKTKIFGLMDSNNVKTSLNVTITRFKKWYVLSTLIFSIIYPITVYICLSIFENVFHFSLAFKWEALITTASTVVVMGFTHWYYVKNYFNWLKSLKNSVKELDESV